MAAGERGGRRATTFGGGLLATLLALWALASLPPLGAWVGVADLGVYVGAWRSWWRLAALGALVAGLLLAAGRARSAGSVRQALARATSARRGVFLGALGLVASLEGALVAVVCFARNSPHIDAWPQYFQAKVFLSGRLTAPMPPSVVHFATLNMLANEHGWFSQYPPVHAALLAVGMSVGAPWIVTPVLAAFFPAAVYLLARRSGDERVARLAAALAVLSPFVITMSASGLNQTAAAMCVAVGLAAAADLGAPGAGALLGLALGLLLGLRPSDGIALALVVAWPVVATAARRAWRPLLTAAAAGALAILPTLLFNAASTGNPFTYGYSYVWGVVLPFGEVPFGEPLTASRMLGYTALDGHLLNIFLLAWPVPVTLLAAGGAAARGGRATPGLRLAAAYLLVLVAMLSLFFFRDTFGGPRYLFSAVPAVLVLVATGLVRLADVERRLGRWGLTVGDAASVLFVTFAALAALLIAPQHLAALKTEGAAALHPAEDARRAGVAHAVVLIPDGWGNRLIVRMWAAGVPVRESPRLFRAFDSCALEERLTAAEQAGVRGPALVARLDADARATDPGEHVAITPDPLTRLPSDPHHFTQRCREEIDRDRQGVLEFAPFLHLNAPTLDGDVVWARELGPAIDAKLRARYPDRTFYRYTIAPGSSRPGFTKLEPPT